MRHSLLTRLIHLKHQWLQLLLWLLLPLILTWVIMTAISQTQSETKIPVGIILEEETPLALELYEKIQDAPRIQASRLTESEARQQLIKHELDSVFIIHDGYEKSINQDDRNDLLTGLKSDLSFGYTPTSEVIMSFVQEHAVRSKAAHVVNDLIAEYDSSLNPTMADIIKESKNIQDNQDFLTTSFTFHSKDNAQASQSGLSLNPWHIWALITLLTTLFIFDWVIKAQQSALQPRFKLMRMSFKQYLLHQLLFYTVLLYVFDLVTAFCLTNYFEATQSLSQLGALLSYRVLLNISAFLLALCFKKNHLYYTVSFTLFLIVTIISGVILPIDNILRMYHWLAWFNPVYGFMQGDLVSVWLIIVTGVLILWSIRKERSHA